MQIFGRGSADAALQQQQSAIQRAA